MTNEVAHGSNGGYRTPPTGSESLRLLELAETLQGKREETMALILQAERSSQVRALITFAVAIVVVLGAWIYTREVAIAILGGTVAFVLAAALYTWAGGSKSSLSLLKSNLRRDERALFQVVDLLRETQQSLADSENWSTLQRAEFRIRLSRFDIGPGTGSGSAEGAA
jgi:hypothetical protein